MAGLKTSDLTQVGRCGQLGRSLR